MNDERQFKLNNLILLMIKLHFFIIHTIIEIVFL